MTTLVRAHHLAKHKPRAAAWIGRRFLRRGDGVLDIGAATGEYAALWSTMVGPRGTVFAVDPNPAYGHGLGASVIRQTVAVGASLSVRALYVNPDVPQQGSFWEDNVVGASTHVPCEQVTIDALVSQMPKVPRLIKVDAQGAEAEIVRGATKTLRRSVIWVLELWPEGLRRAGASVLDVVRPFDAHGYHPATVYGQSLQWRHVLVDAARRRGDSSTDLLCLPRDVYV